MVGSGVNHHQTLQEYSMKSESEICISWQLHQFVFVSFRRVGYFRIRVGKMAKREWDSKREIMEAKRRKIMQVLRGEGDNTEEEEKKKKEEVIKELGNVQAQLSLTLESKDQQILQLEKRLENASSERNPNDLTRKIALQKKEIEALVAENQKFGSALDGAKEIWTKFEAEMNAKDNELRSVKQELDGAKRVVKKLTTEIEEKRCNLEETSERFKMEAKERENELRARERELEVMRVEKEKAVEERRKSAVASELLLEAARLRISELSKMQGTDLTQVLATSFRLEKENKELKMMVENKDKGIAQCKSDFLLLQEKILSLLSVREDLQKAISEKERTLAGKEIVLAQVSEENSDLKLQLGHLSGVVDQCKSDISSLMSLSDKKLETVEQENYGLRSELAARRAEININIEDRKHSNLKIRKQQQTIDDNNRINKVLTSKLFESQMKLEQSETEVTRLVEKLTSLEQSRSSQSRMVGIQNENERLFLAKINERLKGGRNYHFEKERDENSKLGEMEKRDDEVASTSVYSTSKVRENTVSEVEPVPDDVHVIFDDLVQIEVDQILEDLLNKVVTVSSINALRASLCESRSEAKTSMHLPTSASALEFTTKMREVLFP